MSGMKRPPAEQGNQGIIGTVQADVVAVGTGARASKVVHTAPDREAVGAALAELRQALAALALNPVARETVAVDVHTIEKEASAPKPDRDRIADLLSGLAGKLKMVGVVVGEGVALGEAIKKVAALLKVPLSLLGLG
jgi:hypothetical protein